MHGIEKRYHNITSLGKNLHQTVLGINYV